jgi:hypothetical protein
VTTYFAMILPGRATLTVQSRPCLGSNTAVGFEVSTTTGSSLTGALEGCLASLLRLRF